MEKKKFGKYLNFVLTGAVVLCLSTAVILASVMFPSVAPDQPADSFENVINSRYFEKNPESQINLVFGEKNTQSLQTQQKIWRQLVRNFLFSLKMPK